MRNGFEGFYRGIGDSGGGVGLFDCVVYGVEDVDGKVSIFLE